MANAPFAANVSAAILLICSVWNAPVSAAEQATESDGTISGKIAKSELNADASEIPCLTQKAHGRAGGLIDIAPDGTGATTRARDCIVLNGVRKAAQIGRTIEISDGAKGPASGPGTATADSGSYALSLVNIRPDWAKSTLTGEANGLNIFVRQARGDTAAILSNVGVRAGFAATLESYTFAADDHGRPLKAVRTQLGVINPRDGGQFGLLVQAADGKDLTAGLRIASLRAATWRNYLEVLNPVGETISSIRGSDGAFVGGDLLPIADVRKTLGSPQARYAATYTQVLQLSPVSFAQLPDCTHRVGAGTLAYISDGLSEAVAWGQIVRSGGGKARVFVKCDGNGWRAF